MGLVENHVYTAHSGVAKKGDKAKQAAAKGAGTSGPIKTPVKLSDEISIIPTKKKSEVIDLEYEEEIDDVEKEVIELGDTPKKDKEEGVKRAAEGGEEEPENKRAKSDDSEKKE